ncbi:gephyrin-like molybdotransferase Glp [Roseovarius arcticus]|uniref:molybdopterin molybdotransferase MoeA n=1 Tax=Roseovarius arcticus TaxID=2547404 RepID=UPI0011107ECF|nr:gephyrin-like molybdotransferase Glp [Roseovarius arcticus]
MITVEDALSKLFELAQPLQAEMVPLRAAAGRVLARPVSATRDQPPFAASAMDGYALRGSDASAGARFDVVGEAAAGHHWEGTLAPGQALRIFTGAPLPISADRVVIQEDTIRTGSVITLEESLDAGPHVRPAGADFRAGDMMEAPRLIGPHDIALLAAMNIAQVPVSRRPSVAIIATGDELALPGEVPGPGQIIASNTFGLAALIEAHGGTARLLPVARDHVASLKTAFALARDADLILTVGGASVGDHDLVGRVAQDLGLLRSFYKIAMRPGKPLMAGKLGQAVMVGLPGNPVSAMVCGHVFILPMLRAMLGLGNSPTPSFAATLGVDLPANGPRAHYMRAHLEAGIVTPATSQDSALLSVLTRSNALLIRPAHEPARASGSNARVMTL